MANGPSNTLIDGAHAGVLVEASSCFFGCSGGGLFVVVVVVVVVFVAFLGFGGGACLVLDVSNFRLPYCRVDVWERKADYQDRSAQLVREVDSFREFSADDGQQKGSFAFSLCDCCCVFLEDVFCFPCAAVEDGLCLMNQIEYCCRFVSVGFLLPCG